MKRRALLAITAAALTLAALPAYAQDTLAAIKAAGKIKVAIEFGRPPWGYKDENLKPTGSDYETAALLAKDLGVSLDLVEVTGPNRVPFLISNRADVVISTFSITPERQKVIDFSVPYASAVQYVAAPKSMNIKTKADLEGKRVGVTRGTTGDSVLTKLAVPGLEVVRFDDESTNMTAFASGQVDIVVQEPAVIARVAAQNPAKEIEPKFTIAEFDVGVGMRKNDTALVDFVNGWVKTSLSNGKLDEIYKRFHGVGLSQAILRGKS
ncbi:transporter substrate-binding domain-containing protein [Pararhizobium sp. YC-54]|uniref:transporter substrate-binding domain-containing protein n=1 Tax=Pararhizobium sp. YC-54 TaxID=2986920 RepID=UPI0021F7BB3F|nr:transporter substrate-binding domain-containing protein [Pararhizobium sp. YC-54]MCW0001824.1 transporter substrate-binding domain-containing protein [Pararhizobium sp. YC-54]